MNIFYLLIGASLFAALIFLAAFIWAVNTGQFDDNETPPYRMLFDDDKVEENEDGKTKGGRDSGSERPRERRDTKTQRNK